MRNFIPTSIAIATCLTMTAAAFAQQRLNLPRGQNVEYILQSGVIDNTRNAQDVAFTHVIHLPGAAWIRIYFGETILEQGSYVRITSLADNEQQVLDATALAMWSNTSAYFNGDSLLLELVAAQNSKANQLAIDHLAAEFGGHIPITLCGLCAGDDRTPSSMDFSGRLMPVGCSAAVYAAASCIVSAGHCNTGANVMQFRVPNSTPGCSLVNPPIADQFPITGSIHSNAGVGSDWAVMTSGTNNLGQTIVGRYGVFIPIAPTVPNSGAIDVWGFGATKTCTTTQTQQRSPGFIQGVASSYFTHTCDTTGGNSGSGVFFNNTIIGIATHCPCPNVAQRIDLPAFVAAREQLCPQPVPPNDLCANATLISPGSMAFTTLFATTDGPIEPGACTNNNDSHIQNDVWFKFLSPCTGTATFSLCGANFNTKMAAYVSCPTASGQLLTCNDDSCGTASEIEFSVNQGTVYRVRVGGHNGATGSGTLVYACTPAPPQCPADCTNDGVVNANDLLLVINSWGPCVGCAADVTGDDIVNANDLLMVINAWGPCP